MSTELIIGHKIYLHIAWHSSEIEIIKLKKKKKKKPITMPEVQKRGT